MTGVKQRSFNIGGSVELHVHEGSFRDILLELADHLDEEHKGGVVYLFPDSPCPIAGPSEEVASFLREVAEIEEGEGDIPPRSRRSRRSKAWR